MITRDPYIRAKQINFKDGTAVLEREQYELTETMDSRVYIVIQGDNLTNIAYKFYNEPLYWYLIADVNKIFNPFELEIGQTLIIPNLSNYQ